MSEHIEMPRGLPDEAYSLGELLDEFSLDKRRAERKIISGLLLALLGFAVLALTLIFCAGARPNEFLKLLLVSIFLILYGLAILLGLKRVGGARVLTCRSGLICLREATEIIRWGDVETLWYETPRPGEGDLLGYPQFKVRRRSDGREFVFNNFIPRLPSLRHFIEKNTLTHLLPCGLKAFNNGEVLGFGPLALSYLGIRRGSDWLYWNEVRGVTFYQATGRIVVSKVDDGLAWSDQAVNDVPNYHVFLEIVRGQISRSGPC
jgi:hypothetical protein